MCTNVFSEGNPESRIQELLLAEANLARDSFRGYRIENPLYIYIHLIEYLMEYFIGYLAQYLMEYHIEYPIQYIEDLIEYFIQYFLYAIYIPYRISSGIYRIPYKEPYI